MSEHNAGGRRPSSEMKTMGTNIKKWKETILDLFFDQMRVIWTSADQALLSSQENRCLVLVNCLKNSGTLAVERQEEHPEAPTGVRRSLAFVGGRAGVQ